MEPDKPKGQVTLTQMLKALDKEVASGVEKRLKRLSKKKAVKAPLDGNKSAKIERSVAYSSVSKEVSQWDPIVEQNRKAAQLKFPLDQQPDVLPSAAESLSELKPATNFEKEVLNVINSSETVLHDNKELSTAEEKYLKAISSEEAQERHRELQRMRVLLSSYASKMRRQKAIKSKSYRRLLKHEKIRTHMKKVESNQDLLMDEIERLQKLRARERASLKHKNTGKWAKHAKFRAKYDETARNAMLEQIGLASKYLEKPSIDEDSDPSDVSDDDEDSISDVSSEGSVDDDAPKATEAGLNEPPKTDRLIISSELIDKRSKKRAEGGAAKDHELPMDDDDDSEGDDDGMEDDDPQRKLMSEAFERDDVVGEFKKAKRKLADEEQPKDIDLYLPGWGDWAGPGIKISKKRRKKHVIKAKKIPRADEKLNHVIISELANEGIKELQVKKLPRGIRSDAHFAKLLSKPTAATFTNQLDHRSSTKPKVETKMGARIEPMNRRVLQGGRQAKWAN